MSFLNQIEHFEPILPKMYQDPPEPVRVECERLIHAAVISRRFLDGLLTNPVKTIDEGFCGEKFAFTREEKQRIKLIRARSLADFTNQLVNAVEYSTRVPAATEMVFAR